MDNVAQQDRLPAPRGRLDPDVIPAPLPDPDAVDDGDEEDGRL